MKRVHKTAKQSNGVPVKVGLRFFCISPIGVSQLLDVTTRAEIAEHGVSSCVTDRETGL